MIDSNKLLEFEVVQVVRPSEVLGLTKEGWSLIGFIAESVVDHGHNDVVSPNHCEQCSNYVAAPQVQVSHVVQHVFAVLGKKENKVIEGLRGEIKSLEARVNGGLDALESARAEEASWKGKFENEQLVAQDLLRQNESLREKMSKHESMLGHLNKAKEFIGTADWKRHVLGESD